MKKTIEIIIFFKPFIPLAIGLFLPNINRIILQVVNSKKYQIVKKTYDEIDSELLISLGGKIHFLELIQETIKAISDKELTYRELKQITNLVIRDFKLDKALQK